MAGTATAYEVEPYFVGLLLCYISQVVDFDPLVRYTPNEIAPYVLSLLAAGLLYKRLMGKGQVELPPEALTLIGSINNSRALWVEGRFVELTPQEYQI